MAITASEATKGAMYRPTKNPSDGVYYERPRLNDETIVKRLSKKGRTQRIRGNEAWTLDAITRRGWVPFVRVTRRYTENGKRTTDRHLTAIPPDYNLREVRSPPAYRQRSDK